MKKAPLLFITILLAMIFIPVAFIWGVIRASFKWELAQYIDNVILSIDQSGNGVGKYMFNDTLRVKGGHDYGNIDLYISDITGRNHRDKTLTRFGNGFRWTLDKALGKDHCINSIES